jgi:hypothetical protein
MYTHFQQTSVYPFVLASLGGRFCSVQSLSGAELWGTSLTLPATSGKTTMMATQENVRKAPLPSLRGITPHRSNLSRTCIAGPSVLCFLLECQTIPVIRDFHIPDIQYNQEYEVSYV